MTANPVKPARYRPGKPTAPEEQSDTSESSDSEASDSEPVPQQKPAKKPTSDTPAIVSSALKKVDLNKRFEQSRKEEETRAAAEAAAEAAVAKEEAEKEAGKESSSEYTSEEESEEEESEEEAPKKVLLRPTFIPKNKRNAAVVSTIEDPEAAAKKKAEDEARKKAESKALLEEHIRRDIEAKAAGRKGWDDDDDGTGLDDTDDLDPAAERAAWKLRELTRVKREREALETIEKEREEIERRRNMDPELRRKEDMEFVQKQREEKKESRGQMGFMQKYYHKGAFYQDDSEILKKDYATAAIEDEVKNRDVLPKYMQVRGDEVGKRGRTRWTHLTAEDTSLQGGGSPWFDKSNSNKRAAEKMGGMRGDERFMPEKQRDREHDGSDDWKQKRDDRGPGGDRFRNNDRGDRERDFGDRRPPEGPRKDLEGGNGGYRDRYVPGGPTSDRDRDDRQYGGDRDRDRDRRRSRSPLRRRGDGGDRDRDRKRPRSPPRRREDEDSGDGDKRRRTEVPVR